MCAKKWKDNMMGFLNPELQQNSTSKTMIKQSK